MFIFFEQLPAVSHLTTTRFCCAKAFLCNLLHFSLQLGVSGKITEELAELFPCLHKLEHGICASICAFRNNLVKRANNFCITAGSSRADRVSPITRTVSAYSALFGRL